MSHKSVLDCIPSKASNRGNILLCHKTVLKKEVAKQSIISAQNNAASINGT